MTNFHKCYICKKELSSYLYWNVERGEEYCSPTCMLSRHQAVMRSISLDELTAESQRLGLYELPVPHDKAHS